MTWLEQLADYLVSINDEDKADPVWYELWRIVQLNLGTTDFIEDGFVC